MDVDGTDLPLHQHQAILMLLFLLGRRTLARRQTSMVGMFACNSLISGDDNVIAFEFLRAETAVIAVVYDTLERSGCAVILDLLLPVRDNRQRDD